MNARRAVWQVRVQFLTQDAIRPSGTGASPYIDTAHAPFLDLAAAGQVGSFTHPPVPAHLPGHVASVSLGVKALRANIGSEQREENHQPRAHEEQACDDVGGPVHTQLNPGEGHRHHCQRRQYPNQRSVARSWSDSHHYKGQGGEHQEGNSSVTRRPRPAVRRDEPEILRWAVTLDYVFGQRHATVLPRPSDDGEDHGDDRKAAAESKHYQEDPGRHERDPRTEPGHRFHHLVERRGSVSDNIGGHVAVECIDGGRVHDPYTDGDQKPGQGSPSQDEDKGPYGTATALAAHLR